MKIKKSFGRVYLSGNIQATVAGVVASGQTTIGTLPPGCEPTAGQANLWVCQGSGNDRFALQLIGAEIVVLKYGPGTQGAGAYLSFSVDWDAATP